MAAPDLHARYEAAFASVTAPFAFVDLDAMWANADDLLRMAAGTPIRVASKSVRCRALLERILERDPGFRGLLTFTLPETLWLAENGFHDLVLAYPTADREALERLGRLTDADPDRAPAVMVDSPAHLDLIEAATADAVAPVQACIELDVGWWPLGGRVKVGPKRSPVRTPDQAAALAYEIAARDGVRLAGLMAYEGHIAGVGDDAPGSGLRNAAIRAMQRRSAREIRARRAAVVEAVSRVTPLGFVNGGGTGSLAATASEPAVTEVTAGSGFYDSVLFDHYRSLDLRPAAAFAMPVVRKPSPRIATVLGGGYLASGAPGKDRLPEPYLPRGLRLDSFEGAGEVQTPVLGEPAAGLDVGDRVYFRHAKAGELCERFASLYLVEGGRIVDEVPTYRGEGKTFL
ncbi:MAG TPA: amino acid deaminase/aldolase [Solirubrobacterales bacterium]|nr:amino acid deaminase/aldolase [Solirubrobacterales bacterium]